MGLLSRIVEVIWGKKTELPLRKDWVRENPQPWPYFGDMMIQAEMYEAHAVTHAAINLIAETCAATRASVWIGEQEVLNHPFIELLDNPNRLYGRFELLEALFANQVIYGMSYWWLGADERGLPAEIWPLDPRYVRVNLDESHIVNGYIAQANGRDHHLTMAEVVQFKRYHPRNRYYGLSPLQPMGVEIAADRMMGKYNYDFFGENVGIPAGMYSLPSNTSDERYDEFKQEVVRQHGGGRRKTGVVRRGSEDGDISWIEAGLSQVDADYVEGRAQNRLVILEGLGIPTGMMSEASTEAHARVAERRFLERIYFRLLRVQQEINRAVMPFFGEGMEFRFEDVRMRDTDSVSLDKHSIADGETDNQLEERTEDSVAHLV